MKFVIGLGNPGKEYKNTRHNVGFMILDAFAKDLDLEWEKNKKFNAEVLRKGDDIFVKPLTYMNLSGDTVQSILSFYKKNPADKNFADSLTVIHDDLDIELGKYKISVDSRSAGHNGVQSIIEKLGTKNFRRIRVGIKPPPGSKVPADKYVLQNFRKEEVEDIKNLTPKIIKEIQ